MKLFTSVCALALGAAVLAAPSDVRAEDYLLATASTGGTYYPVGVAIATVVKVKLQPSDNINMSAINSAGSGENVALIRNGEAQFGILQGLYGAYAATGTGPYESQGPQENLRSVTMLWPNVEHFVVRSNFVDTGSIADMANLKGKTVSMGAQNSGTLGSNRTILNNLGMNMDEDFDLAYMGYGPSADALQNGQIDGMSTPAGAPVSAVSSAFANMGDQITLLAFDDEQIQKANGEFDELWTAYTVPAGMYPSLDKDVVTIAQPNFLAVDASVSEDDVYKITKTMFENLPFLQSIHPATKAMSLETAIAGLPLKLHPGALRYFEEAGVNIPDRLK
ncbi:TAXI family TRAP transporter solute-binding subunit [Acuticoccus sp. M5D2P5]|uniref:TAXI family TRAP transporter solute-binding subunit n=1 Tax=Acuticoccus kalidii TaxID=2910977 RepID=UPI001F20C9E1|nr:TAXI family TRAP transporter solute-binding subunit [Acuticoccus kalidii]MCF3936393.1 TAXI family TRAP transporter solute-binding subunit [Acuticoccus kalidii]